MQATFHVPAHPGSSGDAVSRRMSTLARRDNSAEMAVRRLLHAEGFRYRVQLPVPGMRRRTIDVAFTRARLAVFVDGCFWHGCPQHGTSPKANSAWWSTKLQANAARDADTTEHLVREGWVVLRFWEHEAPTEVVAAVRSALTGGAGTSDQAPVRHV